MVVSNILVGEDGPYYVRVWRQGGEGFYRLQVHVGKTVFLKSKATVTLYGMKLPGITMLEEKAYSQAGAWFMSMTKQKTLG